MKSPAFQFYPADFLADENVVLMSNREIGCYIKLMCYCWREGSIPSDVNKIARLCGEDSSAMADLWIAISSCFELAINDPSRMVHPRLTTELQKQSEHKKERSESGKKGAEARWGKGSKVDGSANGSAIKEPMAKNGFSSSSSSSSSVKKPPIPPNGDVVDSIAREFEEIWRILPKRAGDTPSATLKAYRERRKQFGREEIRVGVDRYVAYCKAQRAADPSWDYQKGAKVFFGPDLHFQADWEVPRNLKSRRSDEDVFAGCI